MKSNLTLRAVSAESFRTCNDVDTWIRFPIYARLLKSFAKLNGFFYRCSFAYEWLTGIFHEIQSKLWNNYKATRRSNARLSFRINTKCKPLNRLFRVKTFGIYVWQNPMPYVLGGKVTRLPTSSVRVAVYTMTHPARLFVKQYYFIKILVPFICRSVFSLIFLWGYYFTSAYKLKNSFSFWGRVNQPTCCALYSLKLVEIRYIYYCFFRRNKCFSTRWHFFQSDC